MREGRGISVRAKMADTVTYQSKEGRAPLGQRVCHPQSRLSRQTKKKAGKRRGIHRRAWKQKKQKHPRHSKNKLVIFSLHHHVLFLFICLSQVQGLAHILSPPRRTTYGEEKEPQGREKRIKRKRHDKGAICKKKGPYSPSLPLTALPALAAISRSFLFIHFFLASFSFILGGRIHVNVWLLPSISCESVSFCPLFFFWIYHSRFALIFRLVRHSYISLFLSCSSCIH